MNKSNRVVFLALLLGFGFLLTSARPATDLAALSKKNIAYAKDRILVKFKDNVSTDIGLYTIKRFSSINVNLVSVPWGESPQAWVKKLSKDPRVAYAELDFKRSIAAVPNDPRFSELWAMNNMGQTGGTPGADIDAPLAWDLTTGSSGVVVGVIDTGVDYAHEDLAPNMWTNPGEIPDNGIDDDGNGYIDDVYGINAITGSGDPMDDMSDGDIYHGTHCAGTIGAKGNNGLGVAGVCWNVKIMALKFLDSSGSGYTSDAITCIQYAIARGANVLSNSWGGGGFDQSLKDAIDAAQTAGILFVAAAGNSGGDTDFSHNYPSCYECDNIISVAATDDHDSLAYFSNWGLITVDVAAPGVDILSTKKGNQYQLLSGTSMATPHVAGLAALLKSYNSGWTWQDIKGRILAGTVGLNNLGGKILTGGRINAYNSLVVDVTVPHIYYIYLTAASPGTTVRITGFGFGASQGAGYVVFSDGQQAAVSSWSDSLILCSVPSQAQTGDVFVHSSSGQASNGFPFVVTTPFYAEHQISNEFTGGGTAQGWRSDDGAWSYLLPFDWTYFGRTYAAGTPIYVSSNGYIDLVSPSSYWYNTEERLASGVRIAPLWIDLMTNGSAQAGEDIYIASDSNRIIIRWCAESFSYAEPMNFEAVLYADGNVKFNYGSGNSNFHSPWEPGPTIGLSDGDYGYAYNLSVYNGVTNLTYAETDLYTPISGAPFLTTTTATNITTTTADSGGNVIADGGHPVTDRGICWGTSANPTISGSHTHDGSGTGIFVSHLTGLTPNTLYHVRAYATDSVSTVYGDDRMFTTLAGAFAVTAPAAGDQWSRGYSHKIVWTKGASTSAKVRIQLYKGNTKAMDIFLKAPNSGSYDWKILVSQAVASNYRIKITTTDNRYSATSGYFAVIKPTITMTSPTGGIIWARGTSQIITWNQVGTQNASVVIQLFKGTTKVKDIATSAPNSGAFIWSIPASLAAGANYKIKLKTVDNIVTAKSLLFTIN